LLQEQVASGLVDRYRLQDGTLLFDDYIRLAYKNMKYITTNKLAISGSKSEESLNDEVFRLFNVNVCKNYLEKKKGYICDREFLNAGLETVSI
jgi:hypothetical protein